MKPEPAPGTPVRVTLTLPSQNASTDGWLGDVVDHPASTFFLVPVRLRGEQVTRFYHPSNLTEQTA